MWTDRTPDDESGFLDCRGEWQELDDPDDE
jgi:hypothetical protein